MTVAELIKVLQNVLDQEKFVYIWNEETYSVDPLQIIDDRDGELVLHP